ncbi:MAG: cytidine deaminase [Planctomycetota bacterium]|nr:MAG: cytidine deaminase [Planctomycetota bacterium]
MDPAGTDPELAAAARAAAAASYSPYSGFAVGAAVRWADGGVSTGTNVENASHPLAVCAERNAVAAGVGRGWRRIAAVAVWADVAGVVSPCGGCRQVLAEFAPDPGAVVVHLLGRERAETVTLAELLPRAFGPPPGLRRGSRG